jgi:transposase-like protein
MEPTCVYYKDTDADYHALRWDGTRNTCEKTDQWECAACGSKHTAGWGRRCTVENGERRVKLATHMAMIGVSMAGISEVMGHSEETVRRWLVRSGVQ